MKNLRTILKEAQTAVEYLIILAVTATVIILGFRTTVPRVQGETEAFFNKASAKIMDNAANAVGKARSDLNAEAYP